MSNDDLFCPFCEQRHIDDLEAPAHQTHRCMSCGNTFTTFEPTRGLGEASWNRPFPQLYRCRKCGSYELMRKPEPWAGHLCNGPDMPIKDLDDLGKYEFVAEGEQALKLLRVLGGESEK